MQNFENRRDRFELFNSMESPLLNITFNLTVPDFREYLRVVRTLLTGDRG